MTEPAPVASFDRSSPVHAYWLANCEGFGVRVGSRSGVVEEVELGTDGRAVQLLVGFGGRRREVVAATAVVQVLPAAELLVVPALERAPVPRRPSRVGPLARRGGAAGLAGTRAAGRASARAAAVGWSASRRGSRTAWHAVAAGTRRAARSTRAAAASADTHAERLARRLAPHVEAALRAAALAADAAAARLVAGGTALARATRRRLGPAVRSAAASIRTAPSRRHDDAGERPDADAQERPV